MPRTTRMVPAALLALAALAPPALPCSLCGGNPQGAVTIRQAAAQARLVLYGTMSNPQLAPAGAGVPGSGTTDFRVEKVLKADGSFNPPRLIRVARYVPVDPKAPPKFILFCDVVRGRLDPFRGLAAPSPAVLDYVKGTLALDGRDPTRLLLFFFQYLDHKEPDLADDAFLEFAKVNDRDICQAASRLAPDKVRRLLLDPKTPADRLGLYAFLLGACGGAREADLLRGMLARPTERTGRALDGILSGYIRLKPREGWDVTAALLADARRPFPDRFAALRTLRFYHASQPRETRPQVLRGLGAVLDQGDLADLAIEDLRRWQLWDLTERVLAQYGKPTHSAPILRRAIVRYALSCPRPEAARFAAALARQDPGLVADVKESLEFEK